MNKQLKDLLVSKGLDEGATEEQANAFLTNALIEGTVTPEGVRKATENDGEAKVQALIDKALSPVQTTLKSILDIVQKGGADTQTADTQTDVDKAMAQAAKLANDDTNKAASNIRVKEVVEQFDDTKTAATFDKGSSHLAKNFGGTPVNSHFSGVSYDLNMPTQRSKAITGAWFKHLINKQCRSEGRMVPAQFKMSELDRQLVQYAAHNCKFVGPVGYKGRASSSYMDGGEDTDAADHWFDGRSTKQFSHTDLLVKALLDDSTSGGLEAVPIEFDANFILTPLLTGELFPLVNVVNVTRRRIEATKIGNPTVSWGTSEGTPIALFNTDSFISAFDNNIYPITGAMEIGRDFQSDSPLDIGAIVVQRYGERFKAEMDTVIANGSGTDRPEGLFQASGVDTVNSAGGAGAAPQIGDYESLQFGIAKEYLQEAGMPPRSRAVYLGTQTSYQRARGIAVDSSNDARRLFGMDEQSYSLFGFKYCINSSAGNAKIGFFCLNRYRLYRRQGLEVRMVRDDRDSALRNTEVVVVRARFGGSLEDASAGVKITDAQA